MASHHKRVETAQQLEQALERGRQAGHLSAYLLRPADLKRPEVGQALREAQRPLVIPLADPALLSGALAWLRSRGGLEVWSTLYGPLERLQG